MARKTASGARKKKHVALTPKELAGTQMLSSASTSVRSMGTCVQPVVPAPDKGMPAFYRHSVLTAPTGILALAANLIDMLQNLSPEVAAEFVALCGEYSTPCMYASLILCFLFFFFFFFFF